MRIRSALVLACAILTQPAALAQNAANEPSDREILDALRNLSVEAGTKWCHQLIRTNSDRQFGLNHFLISPSEACNCTANEATQAMSASHYYDAYLKDLWNAFDMNLGKPARWDDNGEMASARIEYSRIFNDSWKNCVYRLAQSSRMTQQQVQMQQLDQSMQQVGQTFQNAGEQIRQQSQSWTPPQVQPISPQGSGNTYRQIGNTWMGSNGSSCQVVGQSILCSDGKRCQMVGQNLICN